jgi:hypothetical protein
MLAKNWALMRTLRVDLKRSALDSAGEAYYPVAWSMSNRRGESVKWENFGLA